MKKFLAILLAIVGGLLVVVLIAMNVISRREAQAFVHITTAERQERRVDEANLRQTPEEYGLTYEAVTVTSADGLSLVGWYVPGSNDAAVMLLHGYEEMRYQMLEEAAMLQRHGYGALLMAVRAHDESDGEIASFGCDDREMADLDAFYQYLIARSDVDPARIGILRPVDGRLAGHPVHAEEPAAIRAVVAHSAFSSVNDTVETAVTWKTGLPGALFAPFMLFWAQRDIDCDLRSVSAVDWIGDISPRPVFVLSAGLDNILPPDAGERLFAAAGEPEGILGLPGVRSPRV